MNRQALKRYAAVLAAQVEALHAQDLELFEELADEREVIAAELAAAAVERTSAGVSPPVRHGPRVVAGPAGSRPVGEADDVADTATIESCLRLDGQILLRLRELRSATLSELHGTEAHERRVQAYAPGATRPEAAIDLRS
jgi:hypothetical protein